MDKYHFDLLADFFQFYIVNEDVDFDFSGSWDKETVEQMLAVIPGGIAVGTVRNMIVPVDIEVYDKNPDTDNGIWDKINECELQAYSEKIVVMGCTDYYKEAKRIQIPQGLYKVKIYYGNLDSLRDNGLEGDDHYKIVLYPSETK